MSLLDQFTAGATFRSTTPSFDPDQEIEVYVTDAANDGEGVVAQIGESILHFPDGDADLVGCRILARVTEFDEDEHRGTATHLRTIDRGSF